MSNPRLSIIPARAATDRDLKPRDLQVLCVLGRHTDDLGWCRRSQVKMAAEMDCARATVFESIKRLVDTGYLERHVQESDSGRDSAHIYRVILDPVHREISTVLDADDPCRYTGTPAGISAPPAGPEPAPPAGPEPAPINDPYLTTPSNSEREREREDLGREDKKARDRSFWKLVKDWPKANGMPSTGTRVLWDGLSPEDRIVALAKRDAWIALLKSQSKDHFPAPSTYLKERLWEAVPDVVEEARPNYVEARPFGPTWAIERFSDLVNGPNTSLLTFTFIEKQMIAEKAERKAGLIKEKQIKLGWPAVNRMHAKAMERQGVMVASRLEDMKSLVEAVPVTSSLYSDWKTFHDIKGWPWIPDPGNQPVVYFPVGGPAGLNDFEKAIRGNGNDGSK